MSDRARKTDAEWRAELSPEAYHVTRRHGTEPPFTGKYVQEKARGVYRCVCCSAPLFESDTKYDSRSGWPSFWAPHTESGIRTELDESHGLRRVEVLCRACDAHLGHVFEDGPAPTGLRYCINSVALELDAEPTERDP